MVAWWSHSLLPHAYISLLVLTEVMFYSCPGYFLPSTLIIEVEPLIKEILSVMAACYSAAAAQMQETRTIVFLYEEHCANQF